MYNFVYMLRRIHFVGWAFFVTQFPSLQCMFIMYSNIFVAIYLGAYKPLIKRSDRYLEFFNELIITVVTYHEMFYTDWVDKMEDKMLFGWSMIAIIAFNLLINILIVLWIMLKNLRLTAIKLKNLVKYYLTKLNKWWNSKPED